VAYYYFLMAQLPAIIPSAKPSVNYQEYKELASRYLSRHDIKILDKLTLEPPRTGERTGSDVVDEWFERERSLRLNLAKLRGQKISRNVHITTGEKEALALQVSVSQAARNAVSLENPLEAERQLLKLRLQWLDELRGNHFFDSEAVFIYGLTLLLRERGDRFTVEAGQDAYESIYTQILGEEA